MMRLKDCKNCCQKMLNKIYNSSIQFKQKSSKKTISLNPNATHLKTKKMLNVLKDLFVILKKNRLLSPSLKLPAVKENKDNLNFKFSIKLL